MTVKSKKSSPKLSIGGLNCHGMLDKLEYPNVIDLISKHDIFSVSETWLKEKDEVRMPGFKYLLILRKSLSSL